MRQSFYRLLPAFVGAALATAAGTARAATFNTTLDTLLAGGNNQAGITLGDKRYSGFTFSSSGDAPVTAGAVDVSLQSSDGDNHYQLRFSFTRDPLDATATQTTDVVIGYRIDVLGTQLINRVGLDFAGTIGTGTGTGSSAASVIETVRTTNGSDLAPGDPVSDSEQLSVFEDNTPLPDNASATLAVNPTSSLEFVKDILVSARAGSGTVTISAVDNTVDQVPEPASAALLLVGGGMLVARRRRR